MKILALYSYFPSFTMNHFLNIDFLRYFNKTPGTQLKVYGLRCEEGYPDIVACNYDANHTLEQIKTQFYDFDLIICYTKSRMFQGYLPALYTFNINKQEKRVGCWLPSDFAKWNKTPKVIIEEDAHYELNDDWYCEQNFDLIFQRHYSQFIRQWKTKTLWLPFSVDTKIFKPSTIERKPQVCFAGSESQCYIHRNVVCAMLKENNLFQDFKYRNKEQEYITCLQSYLAHLNGSSIYNHTPAKMFEIMASGSALWTNNSGAYGLKQLFPANSFYTYEENYINVKKQLKNIIQDDNTRNKVTELALKTINTRHSHQIRIGEMLGMIKKEFKI